MNSNQIKTVFNVALVILCSLSLTANLNAATCSVSATAPVIDSLDIANYMATTNTDKWWAENSAAGDPKGQTFTTPSQLVVLNAITFEIADNQSAEITKTYVLRVSTIDKVDPGDTSTWRLEPFYSEEATQSDIQWIGVDKAVTEGVAAAPFMTWTFDVPVELAANTEYAIDLGMTSSTSGWQTGIPYVKRTADYYSGGIRYSADRLEPGVGDITINNVSGDRVFHLDISESFVDPQLPTVDAGSDWVSWSGADVVLDDVSVIDNSDPLAGLVYSWSSNEPNDVLVEYSATDVESPVITITKPAGDPVSITFTLAANYVGSTSNPAEDTMTIDVYDDACGAASAFGTVVLDVSDINQDCVTDLKDIAEMALKWLSDYSLTAPAVK